MRILLWILGTVLALVTAVVLLFPVLVDEEALVELVAQRIESQSGVQVAVSGEASLSLFPDVALRTSGVTVEAPDGSVRVEADFFEAGVALMPLLRNSVQMESINVDGLTVTSVAKDVAAARTVELDTSTMSPAELDAYYAARAEARETAATNAAAAVAAPLALEVGRLSLRDIRSRTVDDAGELISEVQLSYLTGEDLNTAGRPIPLTAQIVLPGAEGEDPVEVTLNGLAAVDLDTEVATLSDLSIVVQGAVAEPIELLASGEAQFATQSATLDLALTIGDMRGSGDVRFAAFESPMIDADLALTELNPALLVLAGPEAAAAQTAESQPDPGAAAPLPLHALRAVDTRAKLAIETVVLGAHRLDNVNAQLRVVDGIATLKPVSARLHGGDIAFEAVFNGRYNTARLSSSGGVSGLDIARAVSALETGLAASGVASLEWDIDGSGRSSDELSQSLNGPIAFRTDDITLQGIALERMFCTAIALVNQETLAAEFPADTRFEALSADVQLENGIARLDPLTARLAAVSLGGTGAVNLESQELQASIRAQLSPALGEVDPACRVNERYAALRWPVECSGSLSGDPASWCAVNTTEIIKDLAEQEAKRKVGEEAGTFLKKLFE